MGEVLGLICSTENVFCEEEGLEESSRGQISARHSNICI